MSKEHLVLSIVVNAAFAFAYMVVFLERRKYWALAVFWFHACVFFALLQGVR